jgi:hypothetical protein
MAKFLPASAYASFSSIVVAADAPQHDQSLSSVSSIPKNEKVFLIEVS